MARVARDETRHAALSWAIAAWARARLDAATSERLTARCRDAIASLRAECRADPPPDVVT